VAPHSIWFLLSGGRFFQRNLGSAHRPERAPRGTRQTEDINAATVPHRSTRRSDEHIFEPALKRRVKRLPPCAHAAFCRKAALSRCSICRRQVGLVEAGVLLTAKAAGVGPWDSLLHNDGWDVSLRSPAALGGEEPG